MRIYALWTLVFLLMVYSFKDTLIPIFGLVLMSVVMQRPDFPSYLLGINGLNPWNLLLLAILAIVGSEILIGRARFDLPARVKWMLLAFYACIFLAYARAAVDLDSIPREVRPGLVGFTGEFLINRIKFILPGLLLFLRCRNRSDLTLAVGLLPLCALLYAMLVTKRVPLHTLFTDSEDVFMRYRHRIDRDIGLMAIDMSMLLAGGFWSLAVALVYVIKGRLFRILGVLALGVMFLGMALCHSRGSYIGFAAAGTALAIARWRNLLAAIPVGIVLVFMYIPAIPARLGMGIGVQDAAGEVGYDLDEITAGRFTDLWPAAIEYIARSPILGHGGYACLRTDIRNEWLVTGYDAPFHPHNAYFEALLDMGLVGFVPTMVLHVGIFFMCWRMFRSRNDDLVGAIGGMGLAMITVLLVTSLGAQSFYPGQSTILYWCIWGLALRAAMMAASSARSTIPTTGAVSSERVSCL